MTNDTKYADDPTATYRGYRRQALYALFRVFDDALPSGGGVRPEGIEDVEILDADGKTIEFVQVKDYTDNLTASKFKPSWFHRISDFCEADKDVQVTVASFGPIGPEFSKATNDAEETPSRVLDTITKDRVVERQSPDGKKRSVTIPGLPRDKAIQVLSRIDSVRVEEGELTDQIILKLSQTITAGEPAAAFEILMWWILTASEDRLLLTRENTIDKLNDVGKFLTHRAAFEHEWHTSIVPIDPQTESLDQRRLQQDFHRGARCESRAYRVGSGRASLYLAQTD